MEYYTWVLSLHVIAVLSWMAVLFYLPRLFVYHVENIDKKEFVEVVKIQELKIDAYIGHPAMAVTLLSGIAMIILNPVLLSQDWMIAKIVALLLMIAYAISLTKFRKSLANYSCNKNGRFFRMYNEIPTGLAILIVTYVITKNLSWIFTAIVVLLFTFICYKIINNKKA
ncbi:protoporphyrinogen oxidase HemJ [Arcobacter vandammei]|uniref:protoporphyrinogen oxidase HemJ n=1 Tax=Arcobacter vandammei TaxID=2782243 RepID=UPI0018DF11C0|nr:protoporphyrinogen oxidase HemJ [Arcobacter vandammei]